MGYLDDIATGIDAFYEEVLKRYPNVQRLNDFFDDTGVAMMVAYLHRITGKYGKEPATIMSWNDQDLYEMKLSRTTKAIVLRCEDAIYAAIAGKQRMIDAVFSSYAKHLPAHKEYVRRACAQEFGVVIDFEDDPAVN